MTISSLIRKTITPGDGVNTAFNFAFQVRSAADLQVYYTDATGAQTLLASNAWSVVLNPIPSGQLWSAGGSVTYPLAGSAIAAGTNLTIVRNLALLQSSSLINQGGYFPDVVEAALDVLTMEMQQLSETIGRALTLQVSSSASTNLPNPLANAAIGWDPTGTFITNLLAVGNIAVPVAVSQGGTGVVLASAIGKINWAVAAGTADVITAAYTPANGAVVDGMILGFRATAANATTTPSFSPDGLAARTIVKRGGAALVAGDIAGNLAEYFVRYNAANTRWELMNPTIPPAGSSITLGTPVASTAGTSIDFTGLPAGVKRITINFKGVSTSGTDNLFFQIGDAGGIEAAGYLGNGGSISNAGASGVVTYTLGWGMPSGSAAAVLHGTLVLTLESVANNTWIASGSFSNSQAGTLVFFVSGSKSLAPGPLDRVRVTTTSGVDTFDAGEINITTE